MDYSQWHSSNHDDEPRDQERDLNIPGHGYWASIGPDNRQQADGWSWTILEFDGTDNDEIESGFADDEQAAKKTVDDWEATHQPAAPEPARCRVCISAENPGQPCDCRCPTCSTAQRRSQRREWLAQRYAIRFDLDAGRGEEPTDASLTDVLSRCVRAPTPDEYPAIRAHLDTYRMGKMSAAAAVRDKLAGLAESYSRDARRFHDAAILMQPVTSKEEDTRNANLYSAIAGELRKVAASL